MASRWWIPLLWLLVMFGCGVLVLNTPISAELTLFAPRSDPTAELLLEQMRRGPATRLILIGLSGDEEIQRAEVSRRLVQQLRTTPWFSRVANSAELPPEAEWQALFDQRYLLSPAITAERFHPDTLRTALRQRLIELQSPLGLLQKRRLAADPTGEGLALLQHWQRGLREPAQRHGVWFSPDGARALLVATTHASGYDLAAQRQAVAAIHTAFAAAQADTAVTLTLSGPGVLAVLSAETVRSQAAWLSGLALAGVILLLLLVYRSIRTLWLGALPILAALLVGAAATAALFGQIYLITLAFSMTLLGETLDYPTYLFSHRRQGETVTQTLDYLWPTLRLCALTTVLGCVAMLDPGFPGLSQLGVYTLAGIIAAALTTRWLLPALTPPHWQPPQPIAIGPWADALLRPRPRLKRALGGSAMLVALILAFQAPEWWQNDLAALSPLPPALLRTDQALRQELGAPEAGHLIVITGAEAEAVLHHSEVVGHFLDQQQQAGALKGYDGPMRYLPSIYSQQQRQAALPEPERLRTALETALVGLPFKTGLFEPFIEAVAAARTAPPLRPETMQDGLLALRTEALLSISERGWTALLPLSGVRDPTALAAGLPPGRASQAHYLDLRAETNRIVADFRTAALERLVVGAVLIVAVIGWGLRSWRGVVVALLPVLLALVFTVAALLALGERLSLFHLVSLLLVVGIGVDYGLFFSRPNPDPERHRRTLHALLVCCGSALTVFAMLATAALPALRAIGLTVSLGVAASFGAALILAHPPKSPPD